MDSEYDLDRLERVKATPTQLKLRKFKVPPMVWVPLLMIVFGAAFMFAFKMSSALQQSSWNLPITLGLFGVAICFMCVDIVAQLKSEVQTWMRWSKDYGLGEWSGDLLPFNGFGLAKFCPPFDAGGVYYTVHHSVEWIDFILRLIFRPVRIPWNQIQSVRWADSIITINLSNGEQLSSGPSSDFFDEAQRCMPPGTVTYDSSGLEQ